jgi:hypothetical protein
MNYKLTVIQPFAGYAVGDDITVAEEVKAALASNPEFVVRSKAGDRPEANDINSPPPIKPAAPKT